MEVFSSKGIIRGVLRAGGLFFQKGKGELVFCPAPFLIAAVAFGFFFAAFFANVGGNVLFLLFAVAEAGSAFDYRLFF